MIKEATKNAKTVTQKLRNVIVSMNNGLSVKFFHSVFQAFQLDFLMAAFANIRFANFTGYFGILNFSLSTVVILFYMILIFYTLLKSRKLHQARQEELKVKKLKDKSEFNAKKNTDSDAETEASGEL